MAKAKKGKMPAGLKRYWAARRGKTKKGVSTSMARRKGTRRRKGGIRIPLGITTGVALAANQVIQHGRLYGMNGAAREAGRTLLGWDFTEGKFYGWSTMKYGLGPIAIGGAVSWLLGGKLGINRMLGRMGVPLIRL